MTMHINIHKFRPLSDKSVSSEQIQLLFHNIVSLRGAGDFSRDFTTNLTPQCRAFSRALKTEKLNALGEPWIQMVLDVKHKMSNMGG